MHNQTTILDADLSGTSAPAPQPRVIAKARHRFVAQLADGLLIVGVSVAVNVLLSAENLIATTLLMAATTAYKVYMEYAFGGTLGKQWVELEVVTADFGKPQIFDILKRNVFIILYTVVAIVIYAAIYRQLMSGAEVVSSLFAWLGTAAILYAITVVVDAFMMVTDYQRRTLHDRIGNTLVVEKPKRKA